MGAPFELSTAADEVVAAAANLVAALADNKYFLAHRLAAWGVGAPALESAVACAAIAQEEAGHARGLYSLLESFPPGLAPVPLEREHDRERKYCVGYLLEPAESWYRAVAALVLIDRALTVLLEAAEESSFADLRKRAARMLGDEPFHRRFADGRALELVAEPAEARALVEQLEELLPETLCWFGPPDEPGLAALVEAGVVDAAGDELRRRFLASLGELCDRTGIVLPIDRELPWESWIRPERRLVSPSAKVTA